MRTIASLISFFILLWATGLKSQSVCVTSGIVLESPVCLNDNTTTSDGGVREPATINLVDKHVDSEIKTRSDALRHLEATKALTVKAVKVISKQEDNIAMQDSLILMLRAKIKEQNERKLEEQKKVNKGSK